MTLDDWAALARSPFFKAAGPKVVTAITQRHRPCVFERGETVFQQGDPSDACYVVLAGRVKLYRQRVDGEQAVVSIFTSGDMYFEPGMFADGRYGVSAETTCSTRIMRIADSTLRKAIEERPNVVFAMLAVTGRHVDHLVDQVETLKVLSAAQRAAEFLMRRIDAGARSALIRLPFEKCLLASHLGMTPEGFSRAMAGLRKFGVAVHRDQVRIESVAKLADYVGYAPIQ